MGRITRKLCGFLLMFLTGFTSFIFLLLFALSITFFICFFKCTVFDAILCNISEVLFMNPSANVFVFADSNDYHKDWLTLSGGTDRPGELSHNFSISNDLTRMVNYSTQIPDCDSQNLALLDLFISFDASMCSAMAFPLFGNSVELSQFPLSFLQRQKVMPHFIA